MRTVAAGIVAVPAALYFAFVAFMTCWPGSWTSYHVLRPPSARGCQVVVAETGGFISYGSIFLLSAGTVRPEKVGEYSLDNAYNPISRGAYSLHWIGETARLDIHADEPITCYPRPLDCSPS